MNSTAGVQFRLVPRSELTLGQKSGMFQLLSRHFAGVTPEQFARDLAEKNLALLLEREETFVGFSTLLAYTTAFEGEMLNVIYSGDTIVAPEAWGTTALPRAWVAGVDNLRGTLPAAFAQGRRGRDRGVLARVFPAIRCAVASSNATSAGPVGTGTFRLAVRFTHWNRAFHASATSARQLAEHPAWPRK